jgi:hypothetical protein
VAGGTGDADCGESPRKPGEANVTMLLNTVAGEAVGSQSTRPSTQPEIKVVYLILAHRNPEQLKRLVAALPETSPVLIHFDRRAGEALFNRVVELLRERPRIRFVNRHLCYWGHFGIVEGTIELLKEADALEFDYASLLSGADYPIKSNAAIADFLLRNKGAEFLESNLMTVPNRWSNHLGYYKTPARVLRRHVWIGPRAFRMPGGMRKIPGGLAPYGGSQWWTLSREAIAYIVRFVRENPGLVNFFKYSFIPDELLVQTILSNSEFAPRIRNDDLRIVGRDYFESDAPRDIVRMKHFKALQDAPEDKLYARKFNPEVDSEILAALTRHIQHTDQDSTHKAP